MSAKLKDMNSDEIDENEQMIQSDSEHEIDYDSQSESEKEWSLETPMQWNRLIRLIFFSLFLFSALLILYLERHGSPYHNTAYCMIMVQVFWVVQFVMIVLSISHLHLIQVKRCILPNTKFLAVPLDCIEYRTSTVKTISAMSALRGSNTFSLLTRSMHIMFGMTFTAISFKWFEIRMLDLTAVSLLLLLMTAFGGSLLAQWEFDGSNMSTAMHYVGALCAFVSAPLGFAIYQDWGTLSVAMMCLTYFSVIVFGCLFQFLPNKHENPKVVHALSLLCMGFELIAYCSAMSCGILAVYAFEDDLIYLDGEWVR